MPGDIPAVRVPEILLASASIDEYCHSVLLNNQQEMWWFQIGSPFYRGFSRPFQDTAGKWWWRGKPQFAYPVDILRPLQSPRKMPLCRTSVGWQFRCAPAQANSSMRFNVIDDLSEFGIADIDSTKRRAIRKGVKKLSIEIVPAKDDDVMEEGRIVWNSHVERTTWNTKFDAHQFKNIWRPLFDCVGTTVLGAFDQTSGRLCAWLIVRNLSGTVFLDTLASDTNALNNRPNDTLVYVALCNSFASHAQRANFFRYSGIPSIEKFKQSMGFDSTEVPACVQLRLLPRILPAAVRPQSWNDLLVGQ